MKILKQCERCKTMKNIEKSERFCKRCGEEILKETKKQAFECFDREIPLCPYCKKEMFNIKDSITKKVSKYLWKCDCKGFPKDLIMMRG